MTKEQAERLIVVLETLVNGGLSDAAAAACAGAVSDNVESIATSLADVANSISDGRLPSLRPASPEPSLSEAVKGAGQNIRKGLETLADAILAGKS